MARTRRPLLVALLLVATGPASAAPTLTFVDNRNTTGTFWITPTGASVADPDSIAFEIVVELMNGVPAVATVDPLFLRANPGGAPPITGGEWNGLVGSGTSTIKAAFGSDLFTSDAPVRALTIDVPLTAFVQYQAVLAQDGVRTPLLSGMVGIGVIIETNNDFNADGRWDGGDLSVLLANWGAAVPPAPSGWTTTFGLGAPTAPAIDADELSRLLANWGFGTGTNVPEPAGALLSIVALSVLATRRR